MSVSTYFGLTQSGKSHHVEKNVISKWDKVIIFDHAHCFSSSLTVNQPSGEGIKRLFRSLAQKEKYQLVVRPGRNSTEDEDEALLDLIIKLACALGQTLGEKVGEDRRVQLVVDEADFICTDKYQSRDLKHLVNKGRHDNVDSHFIARNPSRIHTDIRANSSTIVSFQLSTALETKFFITNFGRENAKKIQVLPRFHRFEWQSDGSIKTFDENNKIILPEAEVPSAQNQKLRKLRTKRSNDASRPVER